MTAHRHHTSAADAPFQIRTPAELNTHAPSHQWLVHSLWSEQAVGILGGQPKCGKSMLALEFAVAVASGADCLRRFPIPQPGPVLLFAAEDSHATLHQRLTAIAHNAKVDFNTLDIAVIDSPMLRLDIDQHCLRLARTVAHLSPRLVILDPLVRLHALDENAVTDMARLLNFLRHLQRIFNTAVMLVHHARKSTTARPGQALRGSSELHAWGDSNLYLRARRDRLVLSVEHRAAASIDELELIIDASQPALRICEPEKHPRSEPHSATGGLLFD